jgi:hypothetical protein
LEAEALTARVFKLVFKIPIPIPCVEPERLSGINSEFISSLLSSDTSDA